MEKVHFDFYEHQIRELRKEILCESDEGSQNEESTNEVMAALAYLQLAQSALNRAKYAAARKFREARAKELGVPQ